MQRYLLEISNIFQLIFITYYILLYAKDPSNVALSKRKANFSNKLE